MMHYDRRSIAATTAKILLEIGAVHAACATPFKLTSGRASPVYIDCRKLISFVRARRAVMEMAEAVILSEIGFEQIDAIAGGETAGIPFAAWLADRLMLPMQYVRKKPKGFGRNAQIEGHISEGQRLLLVEDLTTDGLSKRHFCTALRHAGAHVHHIFVLFHYGFCLEGAHSVFDELNVQLHALATWRDILSAARALQYFDSTTLSEIEQFLDAPAQWSAAHGGA